MPTASARYRKLRVLAGNDTLDQEFHAAAFLVHPFEVVPRGTQGHECGDARNIQVAKHRLAPHPRLRRETLRVTAAAIARIGSSAARFGFAVRAALQIDREHENPATGRTRAPDQSARHLPVVGRIELVPDRTTEPLVNQLDRSAGQRRQHHQVSELARRGSDRGRTFRMESVIAARGTEHDRCRPPGAQKLDRGVDRLHVDETTRANAQTTETGAVGAQRRLIVRARCQIREMRRRQLGACHKFKVHDIERFTRLGDECVSFRLSER